MPELEALEAGKRSVEDALDLPSRLGWPIDNRPQVDNLPHNGVFITFGGPQAHGHFLTVAGRIGGVLPACRSPSQRSACGR